MKIRRPARILAAILVSILLLHPAHLAFASSPPTAAQTAAVIVRARDGSSTTAGWAVVAAGGRVTKLLPIVGGVAADVSVLGAGRIGADPRVLSVTPDAEVVETHDRTSSYSSYSSYGGSTPTNGGTPKNTYLDTTRARSVWSVEDSRENHVQGTGIGVAIVDSGVTADNDFDHLMLKRSFSSVTANTDDTFGHGTHVAGIVAGDGSTNSAIKGIAPEANLYSVKVCDGDGNAKESDVVNALQWVLDNKDVYRIKVVNLSVNCGVEQSYDKSPLDAACEILWFNRIVVVVSAGNKGTGSYNTVNAAPANDPFVITVGASDEKGTTSRSDDVMASFSARGTTTAGVRKPDVVAPGKSIWSVLSSTSSWKTEYPERVSSDGQFFKLSGTSMSAPMVAGTAALMLQKNPNLTPDQVKYRLMHTGATVKDETSISYPYLDAYNAVTGYSTASANTNMKVSNLLTTGENPVNSSVMWNSVMWNSVMWNSVMWNSVIWTSSVAPDGGVPSRQHLR